MRLDSMPPTTGAANGRMTSTPVRSNQKRGSSEAMEVHSLVQIV